jgi:hypothetical protein
MRLRRKVMLACFLLCLASFGYLATRSAMPPACEGCWYPGIPAYPGAERVTWYPADAHPWVDVEFETNDPPEKVFEFYERFVPAQGWAVHKESPSRIRFSRDGFDTVDLELARYSNGKTHVHLESRGIK